MRPARSRRWLLPRAAIAALVCVSASGILTAAEAPARAAHRPVVRGVSRTSVTVAGLGSLARHAGADLGARARIERANAAGGVHGRRIEYLAMRDDEGTADGNLRAGTQLVLQDRVFAVVPTVTADLAASVVFQEQGVPYVGWALSSNFCGNRYGFGITGCQLPPDGRVTSNAWPFLVERSLGAEHVEPTAAIVAETSESGVYVQTALRAAAVAVGFTVAPSSGSLPVPPAGDYDAIAAPVLTADAGGPPDVVFVAAASYSNIVLFERALRNAGFGGVVTNAVEYGPGRGATATGSVVMVQTAPVESAPANPSLQELVADVRAIDAMAPIDQSVLAGYWSADLFLEALRRAGPRLTVGRFLARANRGFTYEVPGVVGPTRFPRAHDRPTPCGALLRSDGLAFSVVVPYSCGAVVPVPGPEPR